MLYLVLPITATVLENTTLMVQTVQFIFVLRLKESQEDIVKFIYSEKATKFCEISTLLLSYVVSVKSEVETSQNFVAFSEYMTALCVYLWA